MKYVSAVLLLFTSPSKFCDRYLIADDPYQFESTSDVYLEKEYDRLLILRNWNKASDHEISILNIIETELRKRECLGYSIPQPGDFSPP